MKKNVVIIILFMVIVIFGLIGYAMKLTNEYTSKNVTNQEIEISSTNLFFEYSEKENIFSWNLYNGKKASFDSTKSGYLYYIFNNESKQKSKNKLLITMGEFSFWFEDNLQYFPTSITGKANEKKVDIGNDLRNNWNTNDKNYPNADIVNKYNIERKVTLNNQYTNNKNQTEYYQDEYYSPYMDIYVNSNNEIIYAVPKDIMQISYVSKDKITNEEENKIELEGKNISNVNNIIDSLGEPNYAIVTNNADTTKLTYVWQICDNYYFYYTMSTNYYLDTVADKIKATLTGKNISDFEYGIVNKNYIYYTNNELARLFDAKEQDYNTETWISTEK